MHGQQNIKYVFLVRYSIKSWTTLILYGCLLISFEVSLINYLTRNYYSKFSSYIWILDHMNVNPFPYLTCDIQVRDNSLK